MSARTAAAGAIYDIGYRRYEGARLGRGYAFRTLFVHTLRSAWGLGRPGRARVIPFVLLALVTFPAVIQVLVGAASQGEAKLISYESYFAGVHALVALFCAAQAPELVSTDQLHRVLPLYFSRPLRRQDYAAARLGGMIAALAILILVPMLVIFLGRLSIAADVGSAMRAELPLLPKVAATTLMAAVLMASISIALAAVNTRRAIASATVLGLFLLSSAVSELLRHTTTGALQRFAVLLNPVACANGVVDWIFHVAPPAKLPAGMPLPLHGGYLLAGVCAWTAAALLLLFTRYAKVSA
jgi:ABC-2 type transport system permease protein